MPAVKPVVSQPGLEPDVMSLKPAAPVEYKSGLRKPSGALPEAILKSLRRLMTPANVYK